MYFCYKRLSLSYFSVITEIIMSEGECLIMYLRRIVPDFERQLNRKTWRHGKILYAPADLHWKDITIGRLIAGVKHVPYDNKWSKVRMSTNRFDFLPKQSESIG